MPTQSRPAPADRPVRIVHAATPPLIDAVALSPGLGSIVHDPNLHRSILRRLAEGPASRLTVAVTDGTLVGHAAVAPSFGRWLTLPSVREYGIEIAREWRHTGLASRLTRAALTDPAVEDEILVAFTLPSSWDAAYEGLSQRAYGQRLEAWAQRYGFQKVDTDEPEVRFQGGAALLVRYGRRVPGSAIATFDRARYVHGVARESLVA